MRTACHPMPHRITDGLKNYRHLNLFIKAEIQKSSVNCHLLQNNSKLAPTTHSLRVTNYQIILLREVSCRPFMSTAKVRRSIKQKAKMHYWENAKY